MKLGEARQVTSQRLQALSQKKRQLTSLLKEDLSPGTIIPNFDRVELSKVLSAVEEEYQQTQCVADHLSSLEANLQNAEAARQQGEAMAEMAEELLKILEVFRRISKGDEVPATDERKLMEYSQEMYMTAKNMALMNQRSEKEKHDSLWEEEPEQEEALSPLEQAQSTEVGDPLAEIPASPDLPQPSSGGE